jgi:DUF4097 and DUF4098 domain-containing protein YvlB
MAGSACVMNVGHDGYSEHQEKRFTIAGKSADLRLATFDGSIEVRSWDKAEVAVQIELRGNDKEAISKIEVTATQKGDAVEIATRNLAKGGFSGIGYVVSASAKLVASVPRNTNLTIRTNDGSIVVERVTGKADIHTDDGSIRLTETAGDLLAETGDGNVQIDDVSGRVEIRTTDGSIHLSGTPTRLRARSDDGTVLLRIRNGAAMTDDWMVDTGDGSVSVELPDGFAAEIEADPGSDGRVRNDLSLSNVTGGTKDKRSLRGSLGAGGKRLVIRTGDGTIHLTRY